MRDPVAENQPDALPLSRTFDEQLPGETGEFAVPPQQRPSAVPPDAGVVDLVIEAIFGTSGLNVPLADLDW